MSVNVQKSQIFIGGLSDQNEQRIKDIIQCPVTPFPLKYLGVPLSSRSLRAEECKQITHRMIDRLKSWSNRFLSRAGRVSLIKSVLQSIAIFWARIFILPKKVINEINSICSSFLWKGYWDYKGGHLVSWEDVCSGKESGGLGIKNLRIMNVALILNQLWGCQQGVSLWSLWLKYYWMKGRCWWEGIERRNQSWVMRRLDKCKRVAEGLIQMTNDGIRWIGKGIGFNTTDTYASLDPDRPRVDWLKLVWNNLNLPKDQVHAWLVLKGKIRTLDKISQWMPEVPTTCALCNTDLESLQHLYFQCELSSAVKRRCSERFKCEEMPEDWTSVVNWFNNIQGGSAKTKIIASLVTRMISEIWRLRNNVIFRNEVPVVECSSKQIINCVWSRINCIKLDKVCHGDNVWLRSIGIRC